jgi:hypothetical protein
MGWLERRLEQFVEKQQPKLIEQARPHLDPNESVERLVVANARRNQKGKPVYAIATDRSVYLFEGAVNRPPKHTMPIAGAKAVLRDDGGVGLITPAPTEVRDDLHDIYVIYPVKGAAKAAEDLVAYVGAAGGPQAS